MAQAATDRRFVFIIQRGAADGLGTLAPTGDPAFAGAARRLRAGFRERRRAPATSSPFIPNLAEAGRMFAAREALFVHAVASPYRDRSHFDGQNILETGGNAAYALRDGWMNRLLGLLPGGEARAIAVSATVPMVLRGGREVGVLRALCLARRVGRSARPRRAASIRATPQLHGAWEQAMQTRTMAGDIAGGGGRNGAATGQLAARLLAGAEGARIAVIETGGWDTHAGQRARLGLQLRGLDAMLGALKTGLGADWANTLVIVATEFGRTAAPNGTGGTDHGTASLAMLFGGAVAGRAGDRRLAGPDVRPRSTRAATSGPRSISTRSSPARSRQHYRLDMGRSARTLFPNIAAVRALEGLVRA